ncbi:MULTISPECIES: CynX/NimT family MFS transporter [Acinetobacter]|nr:MULTISPECIES: MFS transporter [Acinetobacter]
MSFQKCLPWIMLFSIGLCLRTGISSISPILDQIQQDLSVSNQSLGVLTAIPVIFMGILSPLGYRLENILGLKRSILLALTILFIGIFLRLESSLGYALLLFTAALVGIGDAIIRPLVSGFVKEVFNDKTYAAMGLYAASIGIGAALAAYLTPIISINTERWEYGLAFWSIPILMTALFWGVWKSTFIKRPNSMIFLKYKLKRIEVLNLTLFFGLQAGINYTMVAWIPKFYLDAGYSQYEASYAIGIFLILQTFTSLFFPLSLRVLKIKIRGALFFFTGLTIISALFLLFISQIQWWAVISLGIATGGLFPIALILPIEFASSTQLATRLSGITQSFGYLLAGIMPWVGGIIIDKFGSMVGLTSLTMLMALGLGITSYHMKYMFSQYSNV